MRTTLHDYCRQQDRTDLLTQWDMEKNDGLSPEYLSYGSRKKVWWRCEKGHGYQATVYMRTGSGSGCPYCAGKKTVSGETDLASRHPALAAQWHPERNQELTPDQVTIGSHRLVWWQCEQGHEWRAQIKSRVSGSGCPVCTNRAVSPGENDLGTTFPNLAAQWHPTKNGALTPDQIVSGTHRKVWWRCEKGHEWQAQVNSRAHNGADCPYCAGKRTLPGENDLATMFPDIAAQWHPEKNLPLTPEQVQPYANRKAWWLCPLGHTYSTEISARTTRNNGCPYCAGRKVLPGFNDLETLEPQVASQWHPTLNGNLTPQMVTVGSRKKVWWLCDEDHVWKAVIYSRTGEDKCGCPVCAGRVRRKKSES